MMIDCYCKIAQWQAGGRMKFDVSVVAAPRCLQYLQHAMTFALNHFKYIRKITKSNYWLHHACLPDIPSVRLSLCLSVRLNGTTVLPLKGYLSVF